MTNYTVTHHVISIYGGITILLTSQCNIYFSYLALSSIYYLYIYLELDILNFEQLYTYLIRK